MGETGAAIVAIVVTSGGSIRTDGTGSAAAKKTITLASDVVTKWKAFFEMWGVKNITYNGNGSADITGITSREFDINDGLSYDEFKKLMGPNFQEGLYKLIDANMVIGAKGDNSISADEALSFIDNVKRYGELLGFDMTTDKNIQKVDEFYNQEGVELKTVSAADKDA
ncbi:MAG: hypothetical protein AABZ57_06205, partial [Candidatus Margulisiibacteriota bacterium]